MSKQLEFDFGEEFKPKDKIVDYEFGLPIYQSDIDEYRQAMAWAEHPDNPKFDKEEKDAIKR